MLGELAGQVRGDRAAGEADEAIGRGGDRALDDGGRITASVSTVLTIPSSAPETTITAISPACDAWNTPPRNRSTATSASVYAEYGHESEPPLQPLRAEHRRQRHQQAPAEVDRARAGAPSSPTAAACRRGS